MWKDIPGTKFYQVNRIGSVRSKDRVSICAGNYARKCSGKTLSPVSIKGYQYVNLSEFGKRKMFAVHRLVASTFIGSIPLGQTINHKNGMKHDNRVENLEIVTVQMNISHAIETGLTKRKGVSNPKSKLSEHEVLKIRKLLSTGILSSVKIAKLYGVGKAAIQKIKHRRTWRHI